MAFALAQDLAELLPEDIPPGMLPVRHTATANRATFLSSFQS